MVSEHEHNIYPVYIDNNDLGKVDYHISDYHIPYKLLYHKRVCYHNNIHNNDHYI